MVHLAWSSPSVMTEPRIHRNLAMRPALRDVLGGVDINAIWG